jgi:hypothetical protein
MIRRLAVVIGAVVAALICAGGASAAVTVVTEPPPGALVEDSGFTVAALGTPVGTRGYVGVTLHRAGSPCGVNFEVDAGVEIIDEFVTQPFNLRENVDADRVPDPGGYAICAFEGPSYSDRPLAGALDLAVREPLSQLTLRRPSTRRGTAFSVTVTYSAEIARGLFVTVKRAGRRRGCARSAEQDTGVRLLEQSVAGDGRVRTPPYRIEEAGRYLLCGWIAESETDSSELPGGRVERKVFRVTRR